MFFCGYILINIACKYVMTSTELNYGYKVIKLLASGGFAETFLVEDTQMPSKRKCVNA